MDIEKVMRNESFDVPGSPKEEVLVRDRHCIGCKHLLGCKGKPKGVVNCLCYEGRGDDNDRAN